MREIAPDLYVETEFAGVNVGLIRGAKGLAALDLPTRRQDVEEWARRIRQLDKRPLRFIILSDANLERITAGNWLDGAVIAQNSTAAQIAAYQKRPSVALLECLHRRPITVEEALPRPQISFDQQMRLWLDDWEIVLEHCPGPMAGGLIVRLPHARALFTGDLICNESAAPLIAAETDIAAWHANINQIIDTLPDDNVILPGRGPVGNRATAVAFAQRLQHAVVMEDCL